MFSRDRYVARGLLAGLIVPLALNPVMPFLVIEAF